MTVLVLAATLYGLFVFAIVAIALVLFGLVWLVQRWRALRSVPRRGLAPVAWVRDARGTPVAFDQADPGDENDFQTDVVTEGLGEARLTPWPGMEAIDAVRRANPRLSDIQAYAVAVARSRRVQA